MSGTKSSFSSASASKHIMISYQWNDRELALKIKRNLQLQNYKVWIDFDQEHGSILEAMANAVENAAVFLFGVSRKYKMSSACRTEAEYASRLGIPLIPFRAEPQYKPDGWLGLLQGTNDSYDFSDPTIFEDSFSKLLKKLEKDAKVCRSTDRAIEPVSVTQTQPSLQKVTVVPPASVAKSSTEQLEKRTGSHALPLSVDKENASGSQGMLDNEPNCAVTNKTGQNLEGGHQNASGNERKLNQIMISYQWDYKELAKKINEKLNEKNYRVWIDVEKMSGNTLEAMAEAVENSEVILVCMSETYKASRDCSTEANNAYRLNKEIIPLIVEPMYRPDGWLGALVGTRLYFDFSREADFDKVFQDLVKELDTKLKKTDQMSVSNWSQEQVEQWARENKIKPATVASLEGASLIHLKKMKDTAPEFFYKHVSEQLKVTSTQDISILCNALDELEI